MARYTSNFIDGREIPVYSYEPGELITVKASVTIPAAGLTTADTVEFVEIPAGCVVVDYVLVNDDLDANGTPTLAADLGVLASGAISSAAADGGKWRSAATVLQAPAVTRASAASVAEQTALLRMSPATSDRVIGLKPTTGAATAAGGVIDLHLTFRAP